MGGMFEEYGDKEEEGRRMDEGKAKKKKKVKKGKLKKYWDVNGRSTLTGVVKGGK